MKPAVAEPPVDPAEGRDPATMPVEGLPAAGPAGQQAQAPAESPDPDA